MVGHCRVQFVQLWQKWYVVLVGGEKIHVDNINCHLFDLCCTMVFMAYIGAGRMVKDVGILNDFSLFTYSFFVVFISLFLSGFLFFFYHYIFFIVHLHGLGQLCCLKKVCILVHLQLVQVLAYLNLLQQQQLSISCNT